MKTAQKLKIAMLYHYQSFVPERLEGIINNNVIYLSNPDDFNDPWDCHPHLNYGDLNDIDVRKDIVNFIGT